MGHYHANLRDQEFMLFEVLGRDSVLGTGRYVDVDGDTARSLLREAQHLAETTLADAFAAGDRTPPEFDPTTHTVRMPQDFAKAFHAYL
ncbi:MAG: acyl-CoA dehydrogenase family protein, partial [Actinomycetes bacterium]